MMFTVKSIVCKISTSFKANKNNTTANKDIDIPVIKTTGDSSAIEMDNLTVNVEVFSCSCKKTFFDDFTQFTSGRLILLPMLYSPSILYDTIVESTTYFENSQWVLSKYSHCIKIVEVVLDNTKNYTLCVGRDDCKECNIYTSMITAMMFALYSTMYYSASQKQFTVYGTLILQDGRMKIYKATNTNTSATPIILYPSLSGIVIKEHPLEICEILEYIFKYSVEMPQTPKEMLTRPGFEPETSQIYAGCSTN